MPLNIPLPSADFGGELAKIPGDLRDQQRVNLLKQQEIRTQQEQPLKMDALRAKIEGEKALAEWRKKSPGMGFGRGSAAEKNERFFQDLVQKDNPDLKPEQIYEASNNIRNGVYTLPDGTKLNPLSPASDNLWSNMLKNSNTSQGVNQQRFAATTDALINAAEPNAKAAFDYSGALGKTQGSLDRVGEILGVDSPKYNKYIKFTRVDVPTIAGEVMREMGQNASTEMKKMYIDIVNPIAWDQTPKASYERWKHFIKLTKTVARTISKSPAKIKQGLIKSEQEENNVKKWVVQNGKLVEA